MVSFRSRTRAKALPNVIVSPEFTTTLMRGRLASDGPIKMPRLNPKPVAQGTPHGLH